MTVIERIRTLANTGRLMHREANHCMVRHLRAVEELRDVFGRDLLASFESGCDLGQRSTC